VAQIVLLSVPPNLAFGMIVIFAALLTTNPGGSLGAALVLLVVSPLVEGIPQVRDFFIGYQMRVIPFLPLHEMAAIDLWGGLAVIIVAMDIRELDSREFLEAMIVPFEMEFHDAAVVLTVERPFPSRPIQVDSDRMSQVFENIIENAKKYAGNPAEITISTQEEADWIRIVIRDNGIGISEEDTPYLFERFYRGEKSRSRAFGGAGLGLAICKRIVEEHGGHIGVQSKPGTGAEFYLTLPVVKEER
jgi:signal transduction histidine kinase